MKEFGLQVYTVVDAMQNEADIATTFKRIREMGYTQIQADDCEISYEEYGRLARENGIEIVGTHYPFDTMENDFELALAHHQALGTRIMGIGAARAKTAEEWYDVCKRINAVAAKCAEHGMKFSYHNHSHEFIRLENGEMPMEILEKELDPVNVSFCLDTYWVQHGGGDVCSWIERLRNRIDIMHLKDMQRLAHFKEKVGYQYYTEIGQGNMDWPKIIETADRCGVKYFIVEQDHCPGDPFESVKISADYLKTLVK